MEAINDIAQRRLQVRHREMAVVEMSNLIGSEDSLEMTCHLMGAEVGAVGKNREEIAFPGIGDFRFAPRHGTEMAGKAGDVIDAAVLAAAPRLVRGISPTTGSRSIDSASARVRTLGSM